MLIWVEDRLVFLIGPPRSGSTLLTRMLGAHSKIHAPAEPHLLTPLAHLGYYASVEKAPYDPVIAPLTKTLPNRVCDPHGVPRLTIPAGISQQAGFLKPGGKIRNFCTDICDGQTPEEQPAFTCNPLQ